MPKIGSAFAVIIGTLAVGFAAVVQTAPIATSDPTIQAEPVPCSTQDNPGGGPLPGKTQGPFGDRRHNDSVVKGTFTLTCTQRATVKVVYRIGEYIGGTEVNHWSGFAIVNVAPQSGEPPCSTGSPCTTPPVTTDVFSVGGSLIGQREFTISATATVYPAGTIFFGQFPLGSAQVLQIGNLAPSTAML
jgi:hypothetical protein